MEYIILSASDILTLQTLVNEKLKHNWHVTGGLTHTFSFDTFGNATAEYCQAMIKISNNHTGTRYGGGAVPCNF